MNQKDYDRRLQDMAQILTVAAKGTDDGLVVHLHVKADAVIELGFDPNVVITPDYLRQCIKENFAKMVDMCDDGQVYKIRVEGMRDE